MVSKEEYDIVLSLGGTCAAACQANHRKLRKYSLPFDFTFMADTKPIDYFCEGIKDGFKNLLLKENLVELQGDERGSGNEWQYKDNYSGYRYIHLFHDDVNKAGVYDEAIKIIRRRVERLYNGINSANKILVILNTNFAFEDRYIYKVKETFETLYPSKIFTFYAVMFNSENEENFQKDNVYIIKHVRCMNNYDFVETNFEWEFMDHFSIKKEQDNKNKFLSFHKLKKGVGIRFLTFLNTFFRIRLYILGFRLDFCIGKVRE